MNNFHLLKKLPLWVLETIAFLAAIYFLAPEPFIMVNDNEDTVLGMDFIQFALIIILFCTYKSWQPGRFDKLERRIEALEKQLKAISPTSNATSKETDSGTPT